MERHVNQKWVVRHIAPAGQSRPKPFYEQFNWVDKTKAQELLEYVFDHFPQLVTTVTNLLCTNYSHAVVTVNDGDVVRPLNLSNSKSPEHTFNESAPPQVEPHQQTTPLVGEPPLLMLMDMINRNFPQFTSSVLEALNRDKVGDTRSFLMLELRPRSGQRDNALDYSLTTITQVDSGRSCSPPSQRAETPTLDDEVDSNQENQQPPFTYRILKSSDSSMKIRLKRESIEEKVRHKHKIKTHKSDQKKKVTTGKKKKRNMYRNNAIQPQIFVKSMKKQKRLRKARESTAQDKPGYFSWLSANDSELNVMTSRSDNVHNSNVRNIFNGVLQTHINELEKATTPTSVDPPVVVLSDVRSNPSYTKVMMQKEMYLYNWEVGSDDYVLKPSTILIDPEQRGVVVQADGDISEGQLDNVLLTRMDEASKYDVVFGMDDPEKEEQRTPVKGYNLRPMIRERRRSYYEYGNDANNNDDKIREIDDGEFLQTDTPSNEWPDDDSADIDPTNNPLDSEIQNTLDDIKEILEEATSNELILVPAPEVVEECAVVTNSSDVEPYHKVNIIDQVIISSNRSPEIYHQPPTRPSSPTSMINTDSFLPRYTEKMLKRSELIATPSHEPSFTLPLEMKRDLNRWINPKIPPRRHSESDIPMDAADIERTARREEVAVRRLTETNGPVKMFDPFGSALTPVVEIAPLCPNEDSQMSGPSPRRPYRRRSDKTTNKEQFRCSDNFGGRRKQMSTPKRKYKRKVMWQEDLDALRMINPRRRRLFAPDENKDEDSSEETSDEHNSETEKCGRRKRTRSETLTRPDDQWEEEEGEKRSRSESPKQYNTRLSVRRKRKSDDEEKPKPCLKMSLEGNGRQLRSNLKVRFREPSPKTIRKRETSPGPTRDNNKRFKGHVGGGSEEKNEEDDGEKHSEQRKSDEKKKQKGAEILKSLSSARELTEDRNSDETKMTTVAENLKSSPSSGKQSDHRKNDEKKQPEEILKSSSGKQEMKKPNEAESSKSSSTSREHTEDKKIGGKKNEAETLKLSPSSGKHSDHRHSDERKITNVADSSESTPCSGNKFEEKKKLSEADKLKSPPSSGKKPEDKKNDEKRTSSGAEQLSGKRPRDGQSDKKKSRNEAENMKSFQATKDAKGFKSNNKDSCSPPPSKKRLEVEKREVKKTSNEASSVKSENKKFYEAELLKLFTPSPTKQQEDKESNEIKKANDATSLTSPASSKRQPEDEGSGQKKKSIDTRDLTSPPSALKQPEIKQSDNNGKANDARNLTSPPSSGKPSEDKETSDKKKKVNDAKSLTSLSSAVKHPEDKRSDKMKNANDARELTSPLSSGKQPDDKHSDGTNKDNEGGEGDKMKKANDARSLTSPPSSGKQPEDKHSGEKEKANDARSLTSPPSAVKHPDDKKSDKIKTKQPEDKESDVLKITKTNDARHLISPSSSEKQPEDEGGHQKKKANDARDLTSPPSSAKHPEYRKSDKMKNVNDARDFTSPPSSGKQPEDKENEEKKKANDAKTLISSLSSGKQPEDKDSDRMEKARNLTSSQSSGKQHENKETDVIKMQKANDSKHLIPSNSSKKQPENEGCDQKKKVNDARNLTPPPSSGNQPKVEESNEKKNAIDARDLTSSGKQSEDEPNDDKKKANDARDLTSPLSSGKQIEGRESDEMKKANDARNLTSPPSSLKKPEDKESDEKNKPNGARNLTSSGKQSKDESSDDEKKANYARNLTSPLSSGKQIEARESDEMKRAYDARNLTSPPSALKEPEDDESAEKKDNDARNLTSPSSSVKQFEDKQSDEKISANVARNFTSPLSSGKQPESREVELMKKAKGTSILTSSPSATKQLVVEEIDEMEKTKNLFPPSSYKKPEDEGVDQKRKAHVAQNSTPPPSSEKRPGDEKSKDKKMVNDAKSLSSPTPAAKQPEEKGTDEMKKANETGNLISSPRSKKKTEDEESNQKKRVNNQINLTSSPSTGKQPEDKQSDEKNIVNDARNLTSPLLSGKHPEDEESDRAKKAHDARDWTTPTSSEKQPEDGETDQKKKVNDARNLTSPPSSGKQQDDRKSDERAKANEARNLTSPQSAQQLADVEESDEKKNGNDAKHLTSPGKQPEGKASDDRKKVNNVGNLTPSPSSGNQPGDKETNKMKKADDAINLIPPPLSNKLLEDNKGGDQKEKTKDIKNPTAPPSAAKQLDGKESSDKKRTNDARNSTLSPSSSKLSEDEKNDEMKKAKDARNLTSSPSSGKQPEDKESYEMKKANDATLSSPSSSKKKSEDKGSDKKNKAIDIRNLTAPPSAAEQPEDKVCNEKNKVNDIRNLTSPSSSGQMPQVKDGDESKKVNDARNLTPPSSSARQTEVEEIDEKKKTNDARNLILLQSYIKVPEDKETDEMEKANDARNLTSPPSSGKQPDDKQTDEMKKVNDVRNVTPSPSALKQPEIVEIDAMKQTKDARNLLPPASFKKQLKDEGGDQKKKANDAKMLTASSGKQPEEKESGVKKMPDEAEVLIYTPSSEKKPEDEARFVKRMATGAEILKHCSSSEKQLENEDNGEKKMSNVAETLVSTPSFEKQRVDEEMVPKKMPNGAEISKSNDDDSCTLPSTAMEPELSDKTKEANHHHSPFSQVEVQPEDDKNKADEAESLKSNVNESHPPSSQMGMQRKEEEHEDDRTSNSSILSLIVSTMPFDSFDNLDIQFASTPTLDVSLESNKENLTSIHNHSSENLKETGEEATTSSKNQEEIVSDPQLKKEVLKCESVCDKATETDASSNQAMGNTTAGSSNSFCQENSICSGTDNSIVSPTKEDTSVSKPVFWRLWTDTPQKSLETVEPSTSPFDENYQQVKNIVREIEIEIAQSPVNEESHQRDGPVIADPDSLEIDCNRLVEVLHRMSNGQSTIFKPVKQNLANPKVRELVGQLLPFGASAQVTADIDPQQHTVEPSGTQNSNCSDLVIRPKRGRPKKEQAEPPKPKRAYRRRQSPIHYPNVSAETYDAHPGFDAPTNYSPSNGTRGRRGQTQSNLIPQRPHDFIRTSTHTQQDLVSRQAHSHNMYNVAQTGQAIPGGDQSRNQDRMNFMTNGTYFNNTQTATMSASTMRMEATVINQQSNSMESTNGTPGIYSEAHFRGARISSHQLNTTASYPPPTQPTWPIIYNSGSVPTPRPTGDEEEKKIPFNVGPSRDVSASTLKMQTTVISRRGNNISLNAGTYSEVHLRNSRIPPNELNTTGGFPAPTQPTWPIYTSGGVSTSTSRGDPRNLIPLNAAGNEYRTASSAGHVSANPNEFPSSWELAALGRMNLTNCTSMDAHFRDCRIPSDQLNTIVSYPAPTQPTWPIYSSDRLASIKGPEAQTAVLAEADSTNLAERGPVNVSIPRGRIHFPVQGHLFPNNSPRFPPGVQNPYNNQGYGTAQRNQGISNNVPSLESNNPSHLVTNAIARNVPPQNHPIPGAKQPGTYLLPRVPNHNHHGVNRFASMSYPRPPQPPQNYVSSRNPPPRLQRPPQESTRVKNRHVPILNPILLEPAVRRSRGVNEPTPMHPGNLENTTPAHQCLVNTDPYFRQLLQQSFDDSGINQSLDDGLDLSVDEESDAR